MPFASCTPSRADIFGSPAPIPVHRPSRKRKVKRVVNWRSKSKPSTLAIQAHARALLARSDTGQTVKELGEALGMSRQLALYHLKKMAAAGQIVMMFEPSDVPGGLRFRCWNELQMVVNYRIGVAA